MFNVFYGGKSAKNVDIIALLRKGQTRIVLWGGADVVNAYLHWKHVLTTSEPTAESLRVTDALILAIRKELGHDDVEMKKDLFPRFILQEYEVFAKAAKVNPKVSLASLSELEAQGPECQVGKLPIRRSARVTDKVSSRTAVRAALSSGFSVIKSWISIAVVMRGQSVDVSRSSITPS